MRPVKEPQHNVLVRLDAKTLCWFRSLEAAHKWRARYPDLVVLEDHTQPNIQTPQPNEEEKERP
jgi:hypothetical protein